MTGVPLSKISVHAINKLVMGTNDVDVLTAWLTEEKQGARRKSALHRIHHRLNVVRGRIEFAMLERLARVDSHAPRTPVQREADEPPTPDAADGTRGA